eukprot:maker-scaffold_4-snap-gene-2.48-mRNA-1 protein AED:0.01 eAED:0.01 QI:66/1/1/1/1/1/4/705/290
MDSSTHLRAGAFAGLVAESLVHPLDTINTRLKVKSCPASPLEVVKHLVRNEGISSVFRGVSATITCSIPSTALYFYAYETSKQQGQKLDLNPLSIYLISGAISEVAASLFSVPFEVVKSRMQLGTTPAETFAGNFNGSKKYNSMFNGFKQIVVSEGFLGLYAGFRPCLALDCCFSGLQFAIYETIHQQLETLFPNWEAFSDLFSGSFAGGTAAWLTNPLDVVVNRLMVQGMIEDVSEPYRKLTAIKCAKNVMTQEGISGFWRGSSVRVLTVMPLSGLTFAVYEYAKHAFR